MPAYDGVHFDPPAPVARVILRCPQTAAKLPTCKCFWTRVPTLRCFRGLPRFNLGPRRLLNNAVN